MTIQENVAEDLRRIVGFPHVSDDPADLWSYTGNLLPLDPQWVVRPGSADQVREVVAFARSRGIPIIPRGLATRNSPRRPGIHPQTKGGLILETSRLNAIRALDEGRLAVTAEAGVTIADLANHLAARGYRMNEGTMTPFCATVGSLTGVGPGFRKYGKREDTVLDIEAVSGTGELIHTASLAEDRLDLTGLFTASQGISCLGIITAVTYRIWLLPEAFDYLDFEFSDTSQVVNYLHRIDRMAGGELAGVFQVNVWPGAVLRLYAEMPWVRNQNDEFARVMDRYPPFPSDLVGVILEGRKDAIAAERSVLLEVTRECRGNYVGVEPIRDYFVNRNWAGNTSCHEDVSCTTTSWAEPFFVCDIDNYPRAKEISEELANELGFGVGKRYWARASLRHGELGYTVCITFDDTNTAERYRALRFVDTVMDRAREIRLGQENHSSDIASRQVLQAVKKQLDPDGILYPGILYMD